ncbi:MAG: hydroxyacid dehydrogenase [Firmicutes bacterium]|nr:hydroxyacid dehydrogenase [Bacillota bacterium]
MVKLSAIKAIVIDDIHPDGVSLLQEHFQVTKLPALTTEELAEKIEPYHVLMTRISAFIGEKVLSRAANLKVIASATTDLGHIDLDICREKQITVVNAPGGNASSIAELTIGRMIDLARCVPQANHDVKLGFWDRAKYTGRELAGKKLGIVGLGKVAQRVAEIASCLQMEILAYDPYIAESVAKRLNILLLPLNELLKESDIITVHIPLTAETKNLIAEAQFAKMKQGAILLNMGRGGVVNEAALYHALKSGKLAGAGADVMSEEPCLASPLYELENFIVTPHLGGQTPEALRRMALITATKAVEALAIYSVDK